MAIGQAIGGLNQPAPFVLALAVLVFLPVARPLYRCRKMPSKWNRIGTVLLDLPILWFSNAMAAAIVVMLITLAIWLLSVI